MTNGLSALRRVDSALRPLLRFALLFNAVLQAAVDIAATRNGKERRNARAF